MVTLHGFKAQTKFNWIRATLYFIFPSQFPLCDLYIQPVSWPAYQTLHSFDAFKGNQISINSTAKGVYLDPYFWVLTLKIKLGSFFLNTKRQILPSLCICILNPINPRSREDCKGRLWKVSRQSTCRVPITDICFNHWNILFLKIETKTWIVTHWLYQRQAFFYSMLRAFYLICRHYQPAIM